MNTSISSICTTGCCWRQVRAGTTRLPGPRSGWPARIAARFREDLRELLARDFAQAPLWGLKDPRLCHLLPWWQPLWAEMRTRPLFVIVLRDPWEVAASVARRDGFSLGKAYLLWLQHLLAAERATRGAERIMLDFAAFLTDWRQALAPLGALLGQPWPVSLVEAGEQAERFVDSALLQVKRSPGDTAPPLWVDEADAALRRERRTEPELFVALDRIAAQLEAAQSLYGGARDQANDAARRIAALEQQARWYEAEWQKARRRVEAAREQLEKERNKAQAPQIRIISNDKLKFINESLHVLISEKKGSSPQRLETLRSGEPAGVGTFRYTRNWLI